MARRGEQHLFNPQTIHKLQNASVSTAKKLPRIRHSSMIGQITLHVARLADFKFTENHCIEEVESIEAS